MNANMKYLALVMELPGMMLVLGYGLQWLDESYALFAGYGMVIGLVLALVAWIAHATLIMNKTPNE